MSEYIMGKAAALLEMTNYLEQGADAAYICNAAGELVVSQESLTKIASNNSDDYARGYQAAALEVLAKRAYVESEYEYNDEVSKAVDILNLSYASTFGELMKAAEGEPGIVDRLKSTMDQYRKGQTAGTIVDDMKGKGKALFEAGKGLAGGIGAAGTRAILGGQGSSNTRKALGVLGALGAVGAAGYGAHRLMGSKKDEKRASLSGLADQSDLAAAYGF